MRRSRISPRVQGVRCLILEKTVSKTPYLMRHSTRLITFIGISLMSIVTSAKDQTPDYWQLPAGDFVKASHAHNREAIGQGSIRSITFVALHSR